MLFIENSTNSVNIFLSQCKDSVYNIPMSFGKWLRDRRESFGLSQGELSERSGLSVSYISALERDEPNTRDGRPRQPNFKDPKTKASRRYIEISPAMAEVLKSRMKGDLAFPGEKGGPIAPNNLGRRQMAEACKRAGIKKYSIYSLRHSGATIALTHGAHIKAVSERLGHASIQITLDVYAHVLPRMSSQVVQVLTDALY